MTLGSGVSWPDLLKPTLLLRDRTICVSLLYIFPDTLSVSNPHVLSTWVGFGSVTGQGASTKGFLPVGVKERCAKLESNVT
jgi:hypothetical protein